MGAVTLTGKAVLVTGAGRGLGRAYALDAAARGARVLVNDVDADAARAVCEEINTRGRGSAASPSGGADWLACSVSDPDAAEELVAECARRFGRIDGLVNNAAVVHDASPWEETPRDLRRIVDVNLMGTLYCGVAAIRRMRAAGGGSVVNVTSGAQSGIRHKAAYGATKGAVASLTYGWALDLDGSGVRVNAVSPRAHTRMVAAARSAPTGLPDPAVIAPLVSFLLSDAAADVTGAVVRFTGTELGLVAKPGWLEPVCSAEAWTAESIHAAFADTLAARVQRADRHFDASAAGRSRATG